MGQVDIRTVLLRSSNNNFLVIRVDMNTLSIIGRMMCDLGDLIKMCMEFPAYNFSINDGQVVEDCGAISRLEHGGTALVVMKSIVSKAGAVRGFFVLNPKTLQIMPVSKDALLHAQAEQQKLPLIQNAIIRNNTISAYPGKEFIKVVENVQRKSSAKLPNKPEQPVQNAEKQQPHKKHKPSANISQKQMSMLREARDNGACVGYFAKCGAPDNVMEYYCDTMYDEELAKRCKPVFENPNLSLGQVRSLVECASLGVDISDMCDGNSTEAQIDLAVTERKNAIFNGGEIPESIFNDNALFGKCKSMAERTLVNK